MNAAAPNSSISRGGAASALMILAAGASTRLGQPKQLLPFRGRSLLRHAAETALASVCRPVVVVLGAFAERLRHELNGLPVQVAMNLQWKEGMSSSIRAGLKALAPEREAPEHSDLLAAPELPRASSPSPPHTCRGKGRGEEASARSMPTRMPDGSWAAGPEAVVIMLCDQPLISAQFLDRLVAVHQSGGKGIVAAEYGGEGGVPALFSRAYFPELAALRGSRGAKPVIFKNAKHAERIPLPEAVMDVDRREDLQVLGRLAGAFLPDAGENGNDGGIR